MNKEKIKTIAIWVLSVLLFLCLITAGSQPEVKEQKVEVEQTKEEPKEEYKDNLKESFVSECMVEPGMERYCECAYNFLRKNHTISEITTASDEQMFNMILNAVDYCGDYL